MRSGVLCPYKMYESICQLRMYGLIYFYHFQKSLVCFQYKNPLSCANSVDADQTPRFAAFDLALHCVPLSYVSDARH